MQKLISFGAGFTVVEAILGIIFLIIELVGGATSGNSGNVGVGIVGSIVAVGLTVGYFLLMKKLGAWNESAWYTMSGGHKTALFLLALYGMIGGILFIIIFAIIGVFSGEAGKSLKRAKFRSDIESAVHKELDRHGL